MDTEINSTHSENPLAAIQAQREALKNFYKLNQPQNEEPTTIPQQEDAKSLTSSHKNSFGDIDPYNTEEVHQFVTDESFYTILKTENRVLDRLNSAKSDIKSIIYNNYYELIKINTVLEDLILPKDNNVHLDNIAENLTTIRSNINNISSLNIDIFDDFKDNDKNSETNTNADDKNNETNTDDKN